jgi:TetR/AcrR family transcriptional repressor of nem operon
MARPIEFNRPESVVAAQVLFWRQGYTATSLAQLLDAMQIGRSSFYAAFGDKRSLFIECLDLFADRTLAVFGRAWDKHHSPRAFPEFFEQTLFGVPEHRTQRGCMLVNSVLELADVDPEISQLASERLARMESRFADCLDECRRDGVLGADNSAEELAASLMIVNQGLRVASRRGMTRKELRLKLDATLATLGLGHLEH